MGIRLCVVGEFVAPYITRLPFAATLYTPGDVLWAVSMALCELQDDEDAAMRWDEFVSTHTEHYISLSAVRADIDRILACLHAITHLCVETSEVALLRECTLRFVLQEAAGLAHDRGMSRQCAKDLARHYVSAGTLEDLAIEPAPRFL